MFRSKQHVLAQPKVLTIKINEEVTNEEFLYSIWDTLIYRLDHDYVEIIDGPRIYFPKDKYAAEPLNKGFSSFIDYINRQTTDVKIYVPREYFDYV